MKPPAGLRIVRGEIMCNENCGFPCEETEYERQCCEGPACEGPACEVPTKEERDNLKTMIEERPFIELFSIIYGK